MIIITVMIVVPDAYSFRYSQSLHLNGNLCKVCQPQQRSEQSIRKYSGIQFDPQIFQELRWKLCQTLLDLQHPASQLWTGETRLDMEILQDQFFL